jgi:cell division initiation protein
MQPMAEERQKRPGVKRRSRRRSAVERVREVHFPVALRGYDREAVDNYVAKVAQIVAELEATQLRENVVQRALEEVGEQTSAILQRAHESADEMAAQSRARAEGRMQRAERESDEMRRDADRYAEEVLADTKRLREDRKRLIEDIRQFADEVLAIADDALERLPEPEPEAEADAQTDTAGDGASEPDRLEHPPNAVEDTTDELPDDVAARRS